MDVERMRRLSDELLETVACTRPPIPITRVAAAAGALIVIDSATPAKIDGGLFVEGDGALIAVNGRSTMNRQRWTIAHELGHLVQHTGGHTGCYLYSMHQFESDEEREASRFAAEVLMPIEWFAAAWARSPRPDALARLFQVSREAVCRRITELCLDGREPEPEEERGFSLGLPRRVLVT